MANATYEVVNIDDDDANEDSAYKEKLSGFDDAMQNHGTEAHVSIYRLRSGVTPNSVESRSMSGMDYVASFPVDQMTFDGLQEWIRENYGSGTYRVQLRVKGKLKNNTLITIADTIKKSQHQTTVQQIGNNDLRELGRAMLDMQQRNDERFATLITQMQQRPDPRSEMMAQLEMMKMMREAMGLPAQSASMQVPVDTGDPVSQLLKLVEGVARLKELGSGIGIFGEVQREDSLLDVIKDMAPQAMQLLTRQQDLSAAKAQADILTQLPSNPAIMHNPIQQPSQPQAVPNQVMTLLDSIHAGAESDDEAIIDKIVENLLKDPDTKMALRHLSGHEKPFKLLAGIYPPALDAPDYWLDVIESLMIAFERDNLSTHHAASGNDDTNKQRTDGYGSDLALHEKIDT